jgi:hypothetical protein
MKMLRTDRASWLGKGDSLMKRHRCTAGPLRSLFVLVALLAGSWQAGAGASAAPSRAGNSPWTGTFTLEMQQKYQNNYGGGSSDSITASCTATVHRHADGTASANATYTSDETRIQQQSGTKVVTTIHQQGTASYTAYTAPPYFNLAGNGNYLVSVSFPAVQVQVTSTTQQTGFPSSTQHYTTTASCDEGGISATRALPSGTTVTGSTTQKLLDGISISVEWTIQDSTLQPTVKSPSGKQGGPTGKIGVTNNGINASLTYKGWTISYSGNWKKTSSAKATTSPQITSPDQKITVTFQPQPASGAPSAGAAKATITQAASQAGNVNGISFQPFAIGSLTGQIGVVTLTNSRNILLIAVVSDGQHQLITQTIVQPNTPPADLLEAGMAIASLHLAGSQG